MQHIYRQLSNNSKEIFFQLLLHVLLFIFFSFDRHQVGMHMYKFVFFINYAFGALLINHILLPHFYYKKKYLCFAFSIILVLAAVILVEEFVLEKIYFPTTRGRRYSGLFYSLLKTLPIITILSGFKFAWDLSKKQLEVEELRASVKESELQFLKMQINPHFLFNNLNNLYSYAIENSPKTPSIILELSSVLRYMLYDCREDFVSLSKEAEHLRNFTRLNELQIENRGTVGFSANGTESGYQIAPLILMVFIENAFKHSTASQSKDIFIDIAINVTDKGELHFECRNSFRRITNTDNLSNGIGMRNVKKRLELLYPDHHKLYVQESHNLYIVKLKMQLKNLAK